ncbi:protein AIG1-like [Cucumis melo var. makuwa]|uniref:Protein AIG1-like n=1 Tax=Cucumis melo var. makuwa TaxID=1194695 RepID=A0A5A7VR40_CUCMM|nr:protein AIG1-like [Cucumis melo var. makuwa]
MYAGLFDSSVGSEYIAREIAKCVDLVKEGIHAVILVFSVRTRFSEEETATIRTLQTLFGTKIVDFVIVLFTGGDDLEDNDETLEDYLGRECPVELKDIIAASKNRCLVFNNKTKNETKKIEQVEKLIEMVHGVVQQNGGKAYTHGLFSNVKFEAKLQDVKTKLEQQLEFETQARLKAEQRAQEIQQQSIDQIRVLNDRLRIALEKPPPPPQIIHHGRRGGRGCVIPPKFPFFFLSRSLLRRPPLQAVAQLHRVSPSSKPNRLSARPPPTFVVCLKYSRPPSLLVCLPSTSSSSDSPRVRPSRNPSCLSVVPSPAGFNSSSSHEYKPVATSSSKPS